MKFTRAWLEEHLETDAPLDAIVERLSMLGLEVEGVTDRAAALKDFRVGAVTEAKPHPNADKLQLCQVDDGTATHQVVCGAPNARAGMKGAFAPVGTYVPGADFTLKKAKIRGVESAGMLCSARELGLSDEHEGIIELPEDAAIGAPVAEILGLSDPVIEIGLTPNRADCAGVRGIARDLAAAGLGTLKPLQDAPIDGTFDSPVAWRRDFPAGGENACPLVVGRFFRGVTNGESPDWLKARLTAIGLRPISALVDITNYVTFGLARPLHVFDADTLAGDLTMRFARAGETLGALDGKSYTLDGDTVVIADQDGVHGIGGIMGGEGSGCGPDTVNVFLEVALFDPIRIAAAGRTLGIMSDARYRFERGIDPTSAEWGAHVASRLILDICGGEASHLVHAGEMPDWARSIDLRKSRVMSLGGAHVPEEDAARILGALGFEVTDADEALRAAVPPWRADVHGEADLVEEVLRIHGYDEIPIVPLTRPGAVSRPALTRAMARASAARRALAARGLVETVSYSFMPAGEAAHFGGVPDTLRIDNPISADLDVMRPSVLPNLLSAAKRNADRGAPDAALFEIGPHYADDTPDGQILVAAGLRTGGADMRHWATGPRQVDGIDAKADALAALAAIGVGAEAVRVTRDAPAWYHPGRAGALTQGKTVLAYFGELHPGVLTAMDAPEPVAAFEVFLDAAPAPKRGRGTARPALALSTLQPVTRDLAFIVDATVEAGSLLAAARGADKKLISDVSLFDVYEGKGLEPGKKSLAIAITLQPVEATLTDTEIDAVADKVSAAVIKATGGALRG